MCKDVQHTISVYMKCQDLQHHQVSVYILLMDFAVELNKQSKFKGDRTEFSSRKQVEYYWRQKYDSDFIFVDLVSSGSSPLLFTENDFNISGLFN